MEPGSQQNTSILLPPLTYEELLQYFDPKGREKWGEKFEELRTYLAHNPYHGDLWFVLGNIYEHQQEYKQAETAYRKSVECGNRWIGKGEYHLARTLVHLQQHDDAYEWLKKSFRISLRALDELNSDPIWTPLRSDPRFADILPPSEANKMERNEGWQSDLSHLARWMELAHYDLFGRETSLTREVWQTALEQLEKRLPHLEDHEIVVEIMKIVVLANDGHSVAYPFGIKEGYLAGQSELFGLVPVMFYLFEDGLFIRAAAEPYTQAVGARVLQIGLLPAEEALKRVNSLVFRDNAMQVKRHGPLLLSCPALLHALKIGENRKYLDVLLQQKEQEPFTLRFHSDPHVPTNLVWYSAEPAQWLSMREKAQSVPLWLKDVTNDYWFEYLAEKNVVYCQYNNVYNKKEEALAAFSERLFGFIETHDVQALVLDLRLNGGGDLTTHQPLLHGIIRCQKINQKGSFFALISRHTFSAAQHFTNQLDTHTNVTFVGEPSGSRPQFVGEGNRFTLPFSGLHVNASNLFWQSTYAFDRRMWIPPAIFTPMTSHDYQTGRDPALEAIFHILSQQK
jgi:tetratricopeptide (TPR) repeat protein